MFCFYCFSCLVYHVSAQEDAALIQLVNSHSGGPLTCSDWGRFGATMGKSSKQCRERWCNVLNPKLDKSKFNDVELSVLMEAYERIGSRWSVIAAECFPNRFVARGVLSRKQPIQPICIAVSLQIRKRSEERILRCSAAVGAARHHCACLACLCRCGCAVQVGSSTAWKGKQACSQQWRWC